MHYQVKAFKLIRLNLFPTHSRHPAHPPRNYQTKTYSKASIISTSFNRCILSVVAHLFVFMTSILSLNARHTDDDDDDDDEEEDGDGESLFNFNGGPIKLYIIIIVFSK